MVHLTIFHNDEPIKTYEVDKKVFNIGRLPENEIPIASISISRRHVRIEQDASGNYILTDLNSLNGTFVNNKKHKEIPLADGDKITLGKYSILFNIAANEHETTAALENTPAAEVEPPSPQANETEDAFEEDMANNDPGGSNVLIETDKHVVYKLDKEVMTIGSSEQDDIFVDGFLITDGHVLIEKDDDGTWIHANKLMGRFKINGKKVSKHKLHHKDRIEIGTSTFRYMESGQK